MNADESMLENRCGWCLGAHPITACPWGSRLVGFVAAAPRRLVRVWA